MRYNQLLERYNKRTVAISVFIVIALVMGVIFVISALIENYYYNPTKVTVGESKSDIDFDIYALTELNFPGYFLTSDVYVDELGLGEYDISFYLRNLFIQKNKYVATKIKQDRKIKNHTESIEGISSKFTDIRFPGRNPEHINEQKQRVMNHITQLNNVSYVSADLTFEKDLTMDELRELELKYTAFHILEWLVNPTNFDTNEMSLEAKAYELHYKSLLQYMIDRKEATKVLESDFSNRKWEYYRSALDYAEEYGVKAFGVLIYTNAEDLIQLVENESIKLVELNQVLASKGYIQ